MDTATWLRYWRRAVTLAAFLRLVPFVRMVGLNGSMATGTFTPSSDIDLYIVTADRHLYVARGLATVLVHLTGLRIRPGKEAGRFCPNRFAVESFTEITPHDSYHARVFHNLIPLYSAPGVYAHYVASNQWMNELGFPVVVHSPALGDSVIIRLLQWWGELVAGPALFERWATYIQKQRIARNPQAHAPGSKVIVTDRELRFHLAKEVHG